MRTAIATIAFLLAAAVPGLAAAFEQVITRTNPLYEIRVIRAFREIPAAGGVPLRIEIRNRSKQKATWTASWTAGSSWLSGKGYTASHVFHVEAGATKSFPVTAPAIGSRGWGGAFLEMTGPGMDPDNRFRFSQPEQKHPHSASASFAVSESLYADLWPPLEKKLEEGKRYPFGTRADPSEFGSDWSAYAGFSIIAIKDSEYRSLTPAQREALDIWVTHGGRLILSSAASETAVEARGLGYVERIADPAENISPDLLADRLTGPVLALEQQIVDGFAPANLPQWFLQRKPNGVLLLGIMVTFAALVGPVNFFKFAPPGRRHRLFITTPTLSACATAALLIFILLQDGIGGAGFRNAVFVLHPGTARAAFLQEQTAFTGLLFGRSFDFEDREAMLLPTRSKAQSLEDFLTQRGCFLAAGRASGDWFKSRSEQAHALVGVRPGREGITVTNPEAAASGAPPEVISSIGVQIETLIYRDPKGETWSATTVAPGIRTTLTPDPEAAIPDITRLGRPAAERVRAMWSRHGAYVAFTSREPSLFPPTLASIRWKENRAYFTGLAEGVSL